MFYLLQRLELKLLPPSVITYVTHNGKFHSVVQVFLYFDKLSFPNLTFSKREMFEHALDYLVQTFHHSLS